MPQPSEKLLEKTFVHFDCASTNEAFEIVSNFFNFSRLIVKLDKKRNVQRTERHTLCDKTA